MRPFRLLIFLTGRFMRAHFTAALSALMAVSIAATATSVHAQARGRGQDQGGQDEEQASKK